MDPPQPIAPAAAANSTAPASPRMAVLSDDSATWPRFPPDVTVASDPTRCRYHYERKLGQGAYGFTFRLRDVQTGGAVALKIMNVQRPGATAPSNRTVQAGAILETPQERVEMELEHMKRVSTHFCFPRLMGWKHVDPSPLTHNKAYSLVFMECCDGGDLESATRSRVTQTKVSPFMPVEVQLVFVQLMVALNHLHKHGATHRDIKAANILLMNNPTVIDFHTAGGFMAGYVPSRQADRQRVGLCKLTDFGFATLKSDPTTKLGTYEYWAPELFAGDEMYTNKVDVWAAGVVLYEMIALHRPFPERSKFTLMQKAVTSGTFESLSSLEWARNFDLFDKRFFDTVSRMLTVDAAARPSAAELLSSPFGLDAVDNFCRWAVSNQSNLSWPIFNALVADGVVLPTWLTSQLAPSQQQPQQALRDEVPDDAFFDEDGFAPDDEDVDDPLLSVEGNEQPAPSDTAEHEQQHQQQQHQAASTSPRHDLAEGPSTASPIARARSVPAPVLPSPLAEPTPGRLRQLLARTSATEHESPFLPPAASMPLPLGTSLASPPVTSPLRAMPPPALQQQLTHSPPPRGGDGAEENVFGPRGGGGAVTSPTHPPPRPPAQSTAEGRVFVRSAQSAAVVAAVPTSAAVGTGSSPTHSVVVGAAKSQSRPGSDSGRASDRGESPPASVEAAHPSSADGPPSL